MTIRTVFIACACVLGAHPSFGQAGAAAAPAQTRLLQSPLPSSTASAVDAAQSDYVIGTDDMLSIVFWRDQQLSSDVLVRPDGKISLPLLDEVMAAGLTPRQLRDRLRIEAERYVSVPVVTVVVKQINSRKVYITGQVVRPGQYPLATSMTVLQLIATAGGLGDYAKPRGIRVVRVEQGHPVTLRFDYTNATTTSKAPSNIELKSGDTVVVP